MTDGGSLKVKLELHAEKLPKMDLLGKADPFFRIYRKQSDGSLLQVYESEIVKNSLTADWKSLQLPFDDVKEPLLFKVFDWDRGTDPDYIGEFEATLLAAKESKTPFLLSRPEDKDPKNRTKTFGEVTFKTVELPGPSTVPLGVVFNLKDVPAPDPAPSSGPSTVPLGVVFNPKDVPTPDPTPSSGPSSVPLGVVFNPKDVPAPDGVVHLGSATVTPSSTETFDSGRSSVPLGVVFNPKDIPAPDSKGPSTAPLGVIFRSGDVPPPDGVTHLGSTTVAPATSETFDSGRSSVPLGVVFNPKDIPAPDGVTPLGSATVAPATSATFESGPSTVPLGVVFRPSDIPPPS